MIADSLSFDKGFRPGWQTFLRKLQTRTNSAVPFGQNCKLQENNLHFQVIDRILRITISSLVELCRRTGPLLGGLCRRHNTLRRPQGRGRGLQTDSTLEKPAQRGCRRGKLAQLRAMNLSGQRTELSAPPRFPVFSRIPAAEAIVLWTRPQREVVLSFFFCRWRLKLCPIQS